MRLAPVADAGTLDARRADVDALAIVSAEDKLIGALPPLKELRRALALERADLEPEDARLLAIALVQVERAASRLIDSELETPTARQARELPDVSAWTRRTLESLDEHGQVLDDATPKLRSLLASFRSQRSKLSRELSSYARRQPDAVDETVSTRDGRLTVLLRATSEEAARGIRHGTSGSGQSVYVEPLEVVESNNRLHQNTIEIDAERRRIVTEILDFIAHHQPQMEQLLDWLATVDGVEALGRWRERIAGVWAEAGEAFELVGFRHPLLDALLEAARRSLFDTTHRGDAEPLFVELSDDLRLLVITGPNAGGKTVAIKSLGLAALLNQCGVPLPAERATLPLFDHFEALIGDDQDLMAARSTFSGRLERLRNAWQRAGPGSLIAIDELGSGTDPEEGSALAVALLEELADRRATTVVTTHLLTIAAFAAEHPKGAAAAMAFEDGVPTFRLVPGTPGESHALDLARRMELPEAWLERARQLLGTERASLTRLMADLEDQRSRQRRDRDRLQRLLEEAEVDRTRAAEERAELERRKKKMAVELRRRQDEFERRALKRIDQRLADLKSELERADGLPKEAERGKILKAARAERPEALDDLARDSGEVESWRVGDRVEHRLLSWSGSVLATRENKVQVGARGKKIWVDADELTRSKQQPRAQVSTNRDQEQPPTELKLLGFTVEDALETLDDFLLTAYASDLSRVRIVHGHGTGRLRQAVRDFVGAHALVASAEPAPPDQGGNGATIVILAD